MLSPFLKRRSELLITGSRVKKASVIPTSEGRKITQMTLGRDPERIEGARQSTRK